jgi:hypothetical protein
LDDLMTSYTQRAPPEWASSVDLNLGTATRRMVAGKRTIFQPVRRPRLNMFPGRCDRSKGPMAVNLSSRLLKIASGRCA